MDLVVLSNLSGKTSWLLRRLKWDHFRCCPATKSFNNVKTLRKLYCLLFPIDIGTVLRERKNKNVKLFRIWGFVDWNVWSLQSNVQWKCPYIRNRMQLDSPPERSNLFITLLTCSAKHLLKKVWKMNKGENMQWPKERKSGVFNKSRMQQVRLRSESSSPQSQKGILHPGPGFYPKAFAFPSLPFYWKIE